MAVCLKLYLQKRQQAEFWPMSLSSLSTLIYGEVRGSSPSQEVCKQDEPPKKVEIWNCTHAIALSVKTSVPPSPPTPQLSWK